MLTYSERKANAHKFIEEWRGKGYEKADDQTFWNQFLQEVLGIERVHHEIEFQKPIKVKKKNKLAGYIILAFKILEN